MTLLNRPTVVDRPEIVNRDKQEDEEDEPDEQQVEVRALEDGGGPVLHNLEFRPGDYEIVAGANLAAVLATGQDGGEAFRRSFQNAALQLYDLRQEGEDITDIVRFSLENGIAEMGVSEDELEVLTRRREEPETEDREDTDSDSEETEDTEDENVDEDTEGGDEEDTDIEEVEEDIEEIKEEDQEDEEE